MLYQGLSLKVIEAFREVREVLGPGLLELPYHKALVLALKEWGLSVEKEKPFPVFYHGNQVGLYYADLVVEEKLILEVKAVKEI